jgi:aminopeptidase YwaD
MSKGKRSGDSVTITVPAIYNPSQPTRNVLSYLPGVLGNEYVLLGAHFDHLGADGAGMFRGADDNASGTAVMLAVAKAFGRLGMKLHRNVIFAGWTAEECGLVGSNHFADSPPVPLAQLKAVLNCDMVGVGDRGQYETAGGTFFPKQYQVLGGSARDLGFTLLRNEIKGVSDHLAFSRKGIPAILVYAAGKHPNMHTVRDRPELLDPVVLEDTAKLVALALYRLAQQP